MDGTGTRAKPREKEREGELGDDRYPVSSLASTQEPLIRWGWMMESDGTFLDYYYVYKMTELGHIKMIVV